ncbi:unnamed protein product [Caenorhabditis bovis]|uniref:Uncharacterized protein n=1 Tax=Caenorhabditis bovis TaxID=2654633 RepID=A0A8S1EJP1_9PELO|nr:unnamed protein product [Caenorhabditis bovis]
MQRKDAEHAIHLFQYVLKGNDRLLFSDEKAILRKANTHSDVGGSIEKKKNFLYLDFKRSENITNGLSDKDDRPLGITFDHASQKWWICCENNMIVSFDASNNYKKNLTMNTAIKCPTAVTVLERDVLLVLCHEKEKNKSYIVKYKDDHPKKTQKFVTSDHAWAKLENPCRAITTTSAKNILTIDFPSNATPRLRWLNNAKKVQASFPLNDTVRPSYISYAKKKVAITDCITGKVLLLLIDETDDKYPTIQLLQLLKADNFSMNEARPLPEYNFCQFPVGVQIDQDGQVLVADETAYSIKLYNEKLGFVQRISSSHPYPTMSAFYLTAQGAIAILDIKGGSVLFGKLKSLSEAKPWISLF